MDYWENMGKDGHSFRVKVPKIDSEIILMARKSNK
jgi:hypothetical protein